MKHVLEGCAAFVQRYYAAFRAHWAARHAHQTPARQRAEREFLPAHLELIETPVSPTARWTAWIIIAFFCVALLWACLGKLDIVAVAPGRMVADSRTKIVQPLETAVVRRILVRDGQQVAAGQPLIELDTTASGAELSQVDAALTESRMTALRLAAMIEAMSSGQQPQLPQAEGIADARRAAEQQLLLSQFDALQANRLRLQATIDQRAAEIQTTSEAIAPMAELARITKVRAEDYARLVQGNYVGRHDYLLREQERISAERDLAVQHNRLRELKSSLATAQEELRVLLTESKRQFLEQLREAQQQIAQGTPERDKAGQRNRLMTLRAPVAGTVQQLAVHTVGGVVTPAQELLAVVPRESLEVEATILNKDIGFVRAGQAVVVKVESFPYTRYGYLTGRVVSVSHDAAQHETLGSVFPARIRLDGSTLDIDGVVVDMSAGMALSAEVKTGKRRVIDYLLSPLRRHAGEGLRER